VRVACPDEATDQCRGFFTLRTHEPAQTDTRASALPASTTPLEYAVAPGSAARITLIVERKFIVDNWGEHGDEVDVDFVLALDRKGDAELAVASITLDVREPAEEKPGNEDDEENGPGEDAEGDPGDAGTVNGEPTATPSPTATPEPTAEPTATATPPPPIVEEIPTVTATP
jgi:hypothetical protein